MLILPIPKLKEILASEGFIKVEEFDRLAAEAERKQQNIVELLISQGFITIDYYYNILAKSLGAERINLRAQKIEEEILGLLPRDIAQSRRAMIFAREADGVLDAALEDPANLNTLDFLQRRLGAKIKPFLATDSDLEWGLSLYEARLAQDFRKIIEENNVQTRVTFAGNVTRHPAYREYLQEFKNSDTIMRNGFLLGAHHGMTPEDVDYVCDKIKEFFKSTSHPR